MSSKHLEYPKQPIDRLRDGFDKEPRRIDPHPLEESCSNVFTNEYENRKNNLKLIDGPYGSFRFEMETQICSRPLRLSPLKNSFSELNTLWDRDDEITFEDVLGDWTSNPDCH
ncbi:hypothetical protein AV274_3470 [Blastocystis sp. ATCC 50177/Nand II]|uniref:Uncharacterized protein n=1 Tax=Blastocystis sp. subtype 1 (strain ATCC 50177 / NandII) TaxID=478820 RepID=A0A196SEM3_BLAHN|nr:hypothetical protein AV274_3470 [Blastocystis sp. ATCC 50177/Nand II]